jgi:hypothetical protein
MRPRRLLLALALVALGLFLAWRPHGTAVPPPAPPPAFQHPAPNPWLNTTWLREEGKGVIRFRSGDSHYSPDGLSVLRVQPTFRGDEATFQTRIGGALYDLRLTRDGDGARLVGVRAVEPRVGPVIIAKGYTNAPPRPEADALLPVALGTFRRVYP